MDNVIPFKKPKPGSKHRGDTLCRRGFHKWVVVQRPFDVKRGRLVSCYRCERCGAQRTTGQ
jgi:hypothetical protein